MRLIECETLELNEFFDKEKIPPYVILSHTWTQGEVTLQDFEACSNPLSTKRSYSGYGKIKEACRLTRALGYSWCWYLTPISSLAFCFLFFFVFFSFSSLSLFPLGTIPQS